MATYTSNYGWTKPSGSDNVDISVLNNNLDDQDSTIHDAFLNMAPPFSESSTYAVDDIVLYGTGLYKCHTAVVTPGSWTGSTNWQVYKLSEGGSGGGGSSLTAGDYIEIDENNKINVKMEKGDITEYEYRFTGAYSPTNQLTIEKYRDGILVSTESYRNDASYTPIAIDGLFEIWYSAGNPRYYWCYKLLKDSQEHSTGYEDSWYYTDTTTRTETFDVEDDSLTLVRKGELENAINSIPQLNTVRLTSTTCDANGVRGTGLNIEDVVIAGVSSGDSSSDLMWNLGMKNVSGGQHEYTIRFFRPDGTLCSNMNFWADVFYYNR